MQGQAGKKAQPKPKQAATSKTQPKPKQAAASKTQPKPKQATSKTQPKPKQAAAQKTKPVVGLESPRSQYMCRTGVSGAGQCYAIKWGKNEQYASQASAKKAADKWLQQERRKQGLD